MINWNPLHIRRPEITKEYLIQDSVGEVRVAVYIAPQLRWKEKNESDTIIDVIAWSEINLWEAS